MATAADLEHDQNYRVPHGFFTSGLAQKSMPRSRTRSAPNFAASRPRSS